MATTYLGQKGYSILKSHPLFSSQTSFASLRSALTIQAYAPNAPVQPPPYPIYRESPLKFYVPRFYGIQHFGEPDQNKLPPSQDISVVYKGNAMRDYQMMAANAFMDANGCGLISLPCGFGKTKLAMYLIACVGKKTLVIAHKDALLEQWLQNIRECLPAARVGRIQGAKFDVEDKDIVLATLQSLSMKTFPEDAFASFGFTIVDEVHHISTDVFSRALFKIVTQYTLGLSATMERKDGTTPVISMFLGPCVFYLQRPSTDLVQIRCVKYNEPNATEAYLKMELGFQDKVSTPKMLAKICANKRRSEFIVELLKHSLTIENPKQQFIVLASQKAVLAHIYSMLSNDTDITVGYYIGGMKPLALQESATKQVVLATYSMASEGLDIPTLTSLLFATPMTNIEQSVGRILRKKHEFAAVVIDIVDNQFCNFINQWYQRRKYYTKQKYNFVYANNANYFQLYNAGKLKHKEQEEQGKEEENDDDDDDGCGDMVDDDDGPVSKKRKTMKNGTSRGGGSLLRPKKKHA